MRAGWLLLLCAVVIMAETVGAQAYRVGAHSGGASVRNGADVLIADSLHVLRGKKVGVVCNHSSLLSDGTPLYIALRDRGVRVVALFAPEHGRLGLEGAGVRIAGDSVDGIPAYSLYGEVRKPTAAMLRDVEVLLFDMQDIGVRYYTYVSTLVYCMEAAAVAGIEVLVLDRPNPLGGLRVEGPLRRGPRSFVAMLPVPVRHGMTVGELALMALGERWLVEDAQPRVRVMRMDGWRRESTAYADSARWIPPSPNIRTPMAALAYVGSCLLEGSALSEGRGTDEPFLLCGAPFVDAEEFALAMNALALPGVRFTPACFTPRSQPGAMRPRYEGQECAGVRLEIFDVDEFQAFDTGVHILREARRLYGEKMRFTSYLDLLTGRSGYADACVLEASIPASCTGSVDAARFLGDRRPYLLYP